MYILIYFNLKYLGKKDQPIDIHRRAVVHMNCLPLQYLHISTVLASTIDLLVSFIHYTVPLKNIFHFVYIFKEEYFVDIHGVFYYTFHQFYMSKSIALSVSTVYFHQLDMSIKIALSLSTVYHQ